MPTEVKGDHKNPEERSILNLMPRMPLLFICTSALKSVCALVEDATFFDKGLPMGRLLVSVAA